MTKTPVPTEAERQAGKQIAEQPYSVDPSKAPKVGEGAAGPKRWQDQPGQELDDPQDKPEDDDAK